jgi:hypothetical protein
VRDRGRRPAGGRARVQRPSGEGGARSPPSRTTKPRHPHVPNAFGFGGGSTRSTR